MNNFVTIKTGDCRAVLKELDHQSVQCCVTSPPYWGLRDYGHTDQIGLEETPQAYVETMREVFAEVWRVLRDDGTLWLNLGDSYAGGGNYRGVHSEETLSKKQRSNGGARGVSKLLGSAGKDYGLAPKNLVGIPWRVAFALQGDGWYLRNDIIWHKPSVMPESVTDRCTKAHEYLFLLTKQPKYYFDADSIKEPASENDWESRIGRANLNNKLLPTDIINGIRPRDTVKYTPNGKSGKNPDRGDGGRSNVGSTTGMRNKRDVWTVSTANCSDAHFATFPPDLIKPCILAGTKTGDVVLDPFGGSGTTGQVAMELGRRSVLIELNSDYVKLIEQRTNVTPGLAL